MYVPKCVLCVPVCVRACALCRCDGVLRAAHMSFCLFAFWTIYLFIYSFSLPWRKKKCFLSAFPKYPARRQAFRTRRTVPVRNFAFWCVMSAVALFQSPSLQAISVYTEVIWLCISYIISYVISYVISRHNITCHVTLSAVQLKQRTRVFILVVVHHQ